MCCRGDALTSEREERRELLKEHISAEEQGALHCGIPLSIPLTARFIYNKEKVLEKERSENLGKCGTQQRAAAFENCPRPAVEGLPNALRSYY